MGRERWFWPVVIVVMAIGAGLILASLKYDFPGDEFARAFGEALFIAGFLSVTVDRYVKWKMLREVSWDISKYLIGWQLPPEVQDKIRELMSSKVIRNNYDIHYTISPVTDSQVQVQVEFLYDVINLAKEEEPYRASVSVEASDNPTLLELTCDSQDERAKYRLTGEEALMRETPEEPGVLKTFGNPIKIKPKHTAGGVTYRVGGKYTIVVPEKYSDVCAFVGPTTNAKITTVGPDDFEFTLSPAPDLMTGGTRQYTRIFLPGEHIRVRWRRRAT